MNEPEYKDANPGTENLHGKGRIVIQCVVGGIALIALTILGSVVKPLGLFLGGAAFFYGLSMIIRRRKFNLPFHVIITTCGFLLLLTHPRFGIIAGIAPTVLIIGAVGCVVFGLVNAIKLAWDIGKFSS
ncbi:MAG: hypothetical protein FWC01_07260 [Treponema sp.]|nr:hypothetical protein [Treponema sp.]MCL2238013.1 hypothetical protein [Treponema sp.]